MKQTFFSVIAGLGIFLVGFFIMKWSLLFTVPLTFAVYYGTSLVLTPKLKVGDVYLEQTALNNELKALYEKSSQDLVELKSYVNKIDNRVILEKLNKLVDIGSGILGYLKDKPMELSSSRHFLEYYLAKSINLLDNYNQIEDIGLEEEKMEKINSQTISAMDYLIDLYTKQRDNYYKDQVAELEMTNEILEKTVKYGQGMLDEEREEALDGDI